MYWIWLLTQAYCTYRMSPTRMNLELSKVPSFRRDRSTFLLHASSSGRDRSVFLLEVPSSRRDRSTFLLEVPSSKRDRSVFLLEVPSSRRDRSIILLHASSTGRDRSTFLLHASSFRRDRINPALIRLLDPCHSHVESARSHPSPLDECSRTQRGTDNSLSPHLPISLSPHPLSPMNQPTYK